MDIQERIRQIMLSEELPDSEKLDQLLALIPLESFEIDNLNQVTCDANSRDRSRKAQDAVSVTDDDSGGKAMSYQQRHKAKSAVATAGQNHEAQ
jgi:hypothetical protein